MGVRKSYAVEPKTKKEYLRVKNILLSKYFMLTNLIGKSSFYEKENVKIQLSKWRIGGA